MSDHEQTRFANPMEILDPNDTCVDILLNDTSPSMDQDGFEPKKTKRDHMHEAAEEYLEIKRQQRPRDYVAIIGYSHRATLCRGLSNVYEQYHEIRDALAKLKTLSGRGTRIQPALKTALDLVRPEDWVHASGVFVRVLAYSDGQDQSQPGALRLADELKSMGVLIECFGIARNRTEVDEAFLRRVASETDGFVHYRFLGDGE
ncbi:MAG TPA: VWA domain-containing protein, partial [Candidatus Hydrogenedentes bacterium]|nr:VWA domain-containing protein [Candidatus Hydrogenedentota bacterium]